MNERPPVTVDTARRLLAAALMPTVPVAGTLDRVAAADCTVAAVAETLTRWFGPYGYHALLTRALGQTRAAHPALADVRARSTLTPVLDGLAEAAATHGGDALVEGVAALLAAVVGLLGRVVGDQMGLQLLVRSMHALDGPAISSQSSNVPEQPAITGGPTDGANR